MTRAEHIKSYSMGYENLLTAVKELPEEMRHFKQAPDKWSIHEIIIHMADSEVNSYSRARKIICEPGTSIMAYDQDEWARKTNYHAQNTNDALELFKNLRHITYNVIINLPEETWTNYIYHPERGKMTLEDWLKLYDEHVTVHINQMKRNLNHWKNSLS